MGLSRRMPAAPQPLITRKACEAGEGCPKERQSGLNFRPVPPAGAPLAFARGGRAGPACARAKCRAVASKVLICVKMSLTGGQGGGPSVSQGGMSQMITPALGAPSERILPGILLMLLFCLLAPLLDVSSKLAAEAGLPVGQITLARFAVQGALMVPVVWAMGLSLRLQRRALGFVFLRALLLVLSTFSFISGLRFMPVADALAVAFVEPFILLVLARLLFGEQIGRRRILGCLAGFCGAMLVIQPSIAAVGMVALWPLATAFFFAFYMLATRAMSAWMHPAAMQFHTSWAGVVLFAPVMLLLADGPIAALQIVAPQGLDWLWLFGVGFWACLAHLSMTYALKYAPLAVLGPLHYSELSVAVLLGFLIWGDLPGTLSLLGILVIVASGLYIIHCARTPPPV